MAGIAQTMSVNHSIWAFHTSTRPVLLPASDGYKSQEDNNLVYRSLNNDWNVNSTVLQTVPTKGGSLSKLMFSFGSTTILPFVYLKQVHFIGHLHLPKLLFHEEILKIHNTNMNSIKTIRWKNFS
jgi:hypothetical protein